MDESGMDPLEIADDRSEYFLGKSRKISPQGYRNIRNFLSEVTRDWEAKCLLGKHILPVQQKSKEGKESMYLDFKYDVSEEDDHASKYVIIRIRRDTLFVVAYHDGENWNWLCDHADESIPEMEKLKFNGNYESMQKHANEFKEFVYVGKKHLHASLRNLHHSKRSDDQQKALAIMTYALIFCESVRFDTIFNEISQKWDHSCQLLKTAHRVTSWGTNSATLRDENCELYLTPIARDVHMVLNICEEEDPTEKIKNKKGKEKKDAAETSKGKGKKKRG